MNLETSVLKQPMKLKENICEATLVHLI